MEELARLFFERHIKSEDAEWLDGKTFRELYPYGNDALDQDIKWFLEANEYGNTDGECKEGYKILSIEEENELWWEIYNHRFYFNAEWFQN